MPIKEAGQGRANLCARARAGAPASLIGVWPPLVLLPFAHSCFCIANRGVQINMCSASLYSVQRKVPNEMFRKIIMSDMFDLFELLNLSHQVLLFQIIEISGNSLSAVFQYTK